MCGIAGILNLDGAPCDRDDLDVFTSTLSHRGPDGSGIFVDGPLGLGHRRLAILELTVRGAQPMEYRDGRYHITYNGEIYNFLELRRELEQRGHQFTTDSDTEVILAAYHEWGPAAVLRFNGMWAFAIWDSHRRELFLSRDRFGVKPLLYVAGPRQFAFASELKAFFRLNGFCASENSAEFRFALESGGGESVDETLLREVKRLRAGHNMIVDATGVRISRWWRTLDHYPDVPQGLPDQAAQFRELFLDAVKMRLRSDVPVATCLSGGLDSSSIVCGMQALGAADPSHREAADSRRAFIATYPGTAWDERAYAEPVVAKAGVEPHYLLIDADLAIENLQQYAHDFEMIGHGLLAPLWLTYRALRQDGVTVSLDGHGADEMLAGYPRTCREALRADGSFLRAPLRTAGLIRAAHGMHSSGTIEAGALADLVFGSDPLLRKGRSLARRASSIMRGGWRRLAGRSRSPEPAWLEPGTETTNDAEDIRLESRELGAFNGSLYRQFHGGVLETLLQKFDRCSMAHGVEIRMPFLDWRLVCYTFALPPTSKVSGGFSKRVLREAMRGILPEATRKRKGKIGFVSPLPAWFNGPLGVWVDHEVRSQKFLQSEHWNGPAIRDFVATKQRSRSWTNADCGRVWRFVQAHLWQKAYFP